MISETYKRLIDGLKAANGLPSPFRAQEIVDADGGNAGLELADADEALELMRRTIRDINSEDDDVGAGDDKKVDAMTQLGINALPARTLMLAHWQAKLAEAPGAEERRARAAADTAAFVLQCHRRARGEGRW